MRLLSHLLYWMCWMQMAGNAQATGANQLNVSPYIACTALFRSNGVMREDDEDIAFASILAVVWFQENFALPIDESVLERIKAIDWDRLAEAWCP